MSATASILFKTLVRTFYRQHALLLCFIYFLMFLAVGRANGVGLLEYHYALIEGLLTSREVLLLVFFLWLAYGVKCSQFVTGLLRKQEFSFLYTVSQIDTMKLYSLLLLVQLALYLPVITYLVAITWIGIKEQWYVHTGSILLFNLSICFLSAWWYLLLIQNPGNTLFQQNWRWPSVFNRKSYTGFLLRFMLQNNKLLLLTLKLYDGALLLLLLENRDPSADPDIRMLTLFFSLGLLGHGLLIHRLKEMEDTRLVFYRGLPASLHKRFSGYLFFYGCLLLPEIIIIVSSIGKQLSMPEACFFLFFSLGILMLLNSLHLLGYHRLKDYLAAITQILFAIIIAMIAGKLYILSVLIFLLSMILFYRKFYQYETSPQVTSKNII